MTAIAAIRIEGMPVLTGDLLLSSDSAPASMVNLPSLGEIPSRLPVNAVRYASGLRQKICIVNNDLAVAWSGKHGEAAKVLTSARQHFESTPVSNESLQSFFEHYARMRGSFPSSLALLCAFHELKKGLNTLPVQALGKSHVLAFQSPRFGWCELAGSGRDDIKRQLLAEHEYELVYGQANVLAIALSEAVSLGNRLLVTELTTGGATISMGFGGGYEACIYLNGRFTKVSGILNLYWLYHESGGKRFELLRPIIKMSYIDDILIIQRIDINAKDAVNITKYIVEPAERNLTSFERATALTDWEASFVANTVVAGDTKGPVHFCTQVDVRDPPPVRIHQWQDNISITMDNDWLQSSLTRIANGF
jgi:hypothetical protein